jgi:hypothetical protein
MPDSVAPAQHAVKYDAAVQEDGRIAVSVPFAPGTRVVVFVIQDDRDDDLFGDLTAAATSSLDFWDNPLDDEDWNDA